MCVRPNSHFVFTVVVMSLCWYILSEKKTRGIENSKLGQSHSTIENSKINCWVRDLVFKAVLWVSSQNLPSFYSRKICLLDNHYNWCWIVDKHHFFVFQRMMPLEGVQDLLVSALPEVPTSAIFEVRPYASGDRVSVSLKHLKNMKLILTEKMVPITPR